MSGPRFEPTISLGHIIQAIMILAAGLIFALRLEARIDVQEARIDSMEGRVERSEQRTEKSLSEIKQSVGAIEDVVRRWGHRDN